MMIWSELVKQNLYIFAMYDYVEYFPFLVWILQSPLSTLRMPLFYPVGLPWRWHCE